MFITECQSGPSFVAKPQDCNCEFVTISFTMQGGYLDCQVKTVSHRKKTEENPKKAEMGT